MTTQIKAIVLDYGGVLIELPIRRSNVEHIASQLGVAADAVDFAVKGENSHLWYQVKVGEITETAYWKQVEQSLELPTESVEWIKNQLFEEVVLRQELIDYVKSLKGHYTLAILSNAIPSFTDSWRELDFLDLFDPCINSSDIGMAKADPAIFHYTTDLLNLPAEQCIFVDDQLKNTDPAAELGFRAIHYVDETQTINAIKQLLAT